jgi:DNA polymerase-1
MTKRLVLIDGYSFLFRAYHSMPPLTNPAGTVVGALYGYTNMILKIRQELEASHLAVILDAGKQTFRSEIYPEYKQNRPPAPEDLIPQFPLVKNVTKIMNICTLDKVGVEADDIIATLALKAEKENFDVTIISSDKDLTQLITDKIKMYDPMKQKIMDRDAVFEKFGVFPEKIADLLALAGDSADNIPGVPSIGPKTAAELLTKYGDLKGIYANLEDIKQPKRKLVLTENEDKAFLSQKLVFLKTDVELPVELSDISLKEIDNEPLAEFFVTHGFTSLLSKIGATAPVKKLSDRKIELFKITGEKLLNRAIEVLSSDAEIFITNHKNTLILSNLTNIFQIPFSENESNGDLLSFDNESLSLTTIKQTLSNIFQDSSIKKIFTNFKNLHHLFYDNKSAEFFSSPKKQIENYFDLTLSSYLLQDKSKHELSDELTEEEVKNLTFEIQEKYKTHLKKLIETKQIALLYNIDLPFNELLIHMENGGFTIDQNKLFNLTNDFQKEISALEKEIFKISGVEFNVGSPKQLGEILFTKLELEGGKKSKKSQNLSTSSEVLEELAANGQEIATHILNWRHYSKLKGTYTEALPKLINPQTKRIHSTFSSTTTSTGRLSSTNPNLQNIPVRSKEGDLIREAFICKPGHKLISADYSQIELRLLSHLADIPKLQTAFKNEEDIHAATAKEVFGISDADLTPEYRRKAKAINFGIIYGMSSFGLSERLKISKKEAKEYIELYFSRYPEIKKFMDSTIEHSEKTGYVETISGRKLYFPGMKNPKLKAFTQRAVINAPLQGSASDIIKIAMLNLDKIISHHNHPMRLILQVHDELIYEVKEDFVKEATPLIKSQMEKALTLKIPLTVEANSGINWHEIH